MHAKGTAHTTTNGFEVDFIVAWHARVRHYRHNTAIAFQNKYFFGKKSTTWHCDIDWDTMKSLVERILQHS